jgi:hypothetical protein
MYKEDATPAHNLSIQILVNEKYISVKHQRKIFFYIHGTVHREI